MRKSEPNTQTFLLDSNVFIAAIRNPAKQTETLRLLTKIIENRDIRLIADDLPVEKMLRYAELLKSQTATTLAVRTHSWMEANHETCGLRV